MDYICVVKIPQSLYGVRELDGARLAAMEYAVATYKLEVISSFATNILHDVAISHPFRDRREPLILESVRDPNEIEDVWMRQVLPQDHFFAETLYDL